MHTAPSSAAAHVVRRHYAVQAVSDLRGQVQACAMQLSGVSERTQPVPEVHFQLGMAQARLRAARVQLQELSAARYDGAGQWLQVAASGGRVDAVA